MIIEINDNQLKLVRVIANSPKLPKATALTLVNIQEQQCQISTTPH